MVQVLFEIIIHSGLQVIGWTVMKGITFGRYRGFEPEDLLFEGILGLATVFIAGYATYRLLL